MKKLLFIPIALIFNSVNGQHFVSINDLNQYSITDVQTQLNNLDLDTENMQLNAVNTYKVTYKTLDVNGDTTIASGAICLPQIEDCNSFAIVAYHHGSVLNRINVPSNGINNESLLVFAGNGYIVTSPDYLGLGDNPGLHPYHHAQSEATSSIDLIRATREYLTKQTDILLNGQIFLTGYSQGGHAAMATHKYITENILHSEFNIMASTPMAGSYDLSGAQIDAIIQNDFVIYTPDDVVYFIEAYQYVYGNLYNNYNEMYDSPFDTLIPQLFDGNHNTSVIKDTLPNNLYNILQDSVINNMLLDSNRTTHPLYKDLRDNNVHSWRAVDPIRLLYCGMDLNSPPQDAISTYDSMLAKGSSDIAHINIDPDLGHGPCFPKSIQYTLGWFDSLKIDCQEVNAIERTLDRNIFVYPNPVHNILIIPNEFSYNYIEVVNVLGVLILRKEMKLENHNGSYLDLSELEKGIYFIALYKQNELIFKSKIIKH